MRSEGKSGYLPYLFELATTTTKSGQVKNEVFKLLNDLKDNDATFFLAKAIDDDKYSSIRKELVEACWQNGLNYSGYLPLFTKLVIHGTDEVSFEAFTVIDNMKYMPGNSILEEEIKKIKKHIADAHGTRNYFLNETIGILSNALNQGNE